jgi:hypothetical protein
MRSFSNSEKDNIKKIVGAYDSNNWNQLVLKNLIFSIFSRSILLNQFPGFEIIDGESNDREEIDGYNNAIKNGYIPIAVFLSLLKNLESTALVSIIPYFETEDFDLDVIGEDGENQPENGEEKLYFSIIDHTYLTFLRRNYSYLIYPSQELIDLVNNNFKTKDEKRYKSQIWVTWISIGVALLIGLAGLFKPNSPVKIDGSQMEQVVNEANRSNKRLKEIEFSLDSIKVELRKSLQQHKLKNKRHIKTTN